MCFCFYCYQMSVTSCTDALISLYDNNRDNTAAAKKKQHTNKLVKPDYTSSVLCYIKLSWWLFAIWYLPSKHLINHSHWFGFFFNNGKWIYLSNPPGGEYAKHRVLGYSCLNMMARIEAVPAPKEWPTHTNSKLWVPLSLSELNARVKRCSSLIFW